MTTEQKLDYLVSEVGSIKINLAVLTEKVNNNKNILSCQDHAGRLDEHDENIQAIKLEVEKFKSAVRVSKYWLGIITTLLFTILGILTKQYLDL